MNILEFGGLLFYFELVVLAIAYMLGGLNMEVILGKKTYKIGGEK
jgi:hypothetical protein